MFKGDSMIPLLILVGVRRGKLVSVETFTIITEATTLALIDFLMIMINSIQPMENF